MANSLTGRSTYTKPKKRGLLSRGAEAAALLKPVLATPQQTGVDPRLAEIQADTDRQLADIDRQIAELNAQPPEQPAPEEANIQQPSPPELYEGGGATGMSQGGTESVGSQPDDSYTGSTLASIGVSPTSLGPSLTGFMNSSSPLGATASLANIAYGLGNQDYSAPNMSHAINSALQGLGISTQGPTWGQVSEATAMHGDANAPGYGDTPGMAFGNAADDAGAGLSGAGLSGAGLGYGSGWGADVGSGYGGDDSGLGGADASADAAGLGGGSLGGFGGDFGDSGDFGDGDGGDGGGDGACIIVSACTNRWSYEVNVTREYRDHFLDPITLKGYYAVASYVVPLIKALRGFKWAIKRCLVDRLIDYGEVVLEKKPHTEKPFSRIVSRMFLDLCHYVGRRLKCQ